MARRPRAAAPSKNEELPSEAEILSDGAAECVRGGGISLQHEGIHATENDKGAVITEAKNIIQSLRG